MIRARGDKARGDKGRGDEPGGEPGRRGDPFGLPTCDPGWIDAVDDLEAAGVLQAAAAQKRLENQVEAVRLRLAARWADLHGVLVGQGLLAGGGERLVNLGGDGTPEVAEFAPAELAAVLGISAGAALGLVGDALALRHRLPGLWELVMAGEVPRWVACKIARQTACLTRQACAEVDERVAEHAAGHGWSRLAQVVAGAVIAADPDQAETDARTERRGVWVDPDQQHGTLGLGARGDAPDVRDFDTAVGQVAALLALTGDTGTVDERRARALGVLADPARWQALVDQANALIAAPADPADPEPDTPVPGEIAETPGDTGQSDPVGASGPAGRPRCRHTVGAQTVLYVHLSRQSLTQDGDRWPVARVEQIGPVLADQVRGWLGRRTTVVVRPVVDLNTIAPADRHEVPDRLREACMLRTPADPFPYSPNTSRHGDVDHTIPYRSPDTGGPPAQTRLDNLARLTRFTHRLKTHGGWKLHQPHSGCFLWISPHRHAFLVDHTGTHHLGVI